VLIHFYKTKEGMYLDKLLKKANELKLVFLAIA
jgi:hypothetical protein